VEKARLPPVFKDQIGRRERKDQTMAKNTICVWYDKDAEAAARFYAETFPDSAVGAVIRAPGDYPSGKQGDVLVVEFTVAGVACIGLNGGSTFKHSEAFSFQIATDDQEETDRYWNAIVGNGGQESECGWCKDKWGISWQITPRVLTEALAARRRSGQACLRGDDDDAQDRRRHDRGGPARLRCRAAAIPGGAAACDVGLPAESAT
jgi:predicted 3-demethylubiquinone-9 3-methyltransferase (glyoxalase superfamily)